MKTDVFNAAGVAAQWMTPAFILKKPVISHIAAGYTITGLACAKL